MINGNLACFSKRVTERIGRFSDSYRTDGVAGIVRRFTHHMDWLRSYRQRDTEFDRAFGVDTKGPIELWRLRIRSSNARYATRYEGVDPSTLERALANIHEEFQNFTFIDLGCGKGRALLLASRYGFSRLIGVEFAPKLVETTKLNCERLNVPATVVAGDAAEFRFPPVNLVTYLFNPFGPEVLNPVLDNLLTAQTGVRYVVYINPKHSKCLEDRTGMHCVAGEMNYEVWKVLEPSPA